MRERKVFIRIAALAVIAAAVLFFLSDQEEISESSPDMVGARSGTSDSPVGNSGPEGATAPGTAGANLVTRVGDRYLWQLNPLEQREYLLELRLLAEAGWVEAAMAIMNEVKQCIDSPPETDAEIHESLGLSRTLSMVVEDGDLREMTEEEYAAALAGQHRMLPARLEAARQKRQRCRQVMPEDPDLVMDWLELALEQRFPRLLDDAISGRTMPDDNGWITRNAERLAVFNRGVKVWLDEEIAKGNVRALRLKFSALLYGALEAERRPLEAWVYFRAAEIADNPSEPGTAAPKDTNPAWFRMAVGREPTSEERTAVERSAINLLKRCCVNRMEQLGAEDASLD